MMTTPFIRVAGLDPSLNNFGIVMADLDLQTERLEVYAMLLIETENDAGKQTRKNSDDIRRAKQLVEGMNHAVAHSAAAFCEVPVGSQSARAMASYGICVGVLASCRPPLIQVTPSEVKIAAINCKTASKEEMIEWAVRKHPEAKWLTRGGKLVSKNEHLADALAAIYAGMRTPEWRSTLNIIRQHHQVTA
jgi:Holliday junction resolvasome RuvABC endonuclease subunit